MALTVINIAVRTVVQIEKKKEVRTFVEEFTVGARNSLEYDFGMG